MAGTTGDAKMAEYVQSEFVKAGIPDAEIFALTVGLNYPGEAAPSLALVDAASGETVFAAALSEDVVASDRTSALLRSAEGAQASLCARAEVRSRSKTRRARR